jgi:hypothetical protein
MLIGEGKDAARRCAVLCLSLRCGARQIVRSGNVRYAESLLSHSLSIERSYLVNRVFSFSLLLNTPSRLRLLASSWPCATCCQHRLMRWHQAGFQSRKFMPRLPSLPIKYSWLRQDNIHERPSCQLPRSNLQMSLKPKFDPTRC